VSDRVTRKRRDSHLAEKHPGEPQPHLWRLPDVFPEELKTREKRTGTIYSFRFVFFVLFCSKGYVFFVFLRFSFTYYRSTIVYSITYFFFVIFRYNDDKSRAVTVSTRGCTYRLPGSFRQFPLRGSNYADPADIQMLRLVLGSPAGGLGINGSDGRSVHASMSARIAGAVMGTDKGEQTNNECDLGCTSFLRFDALVVIAAHNNGCSRSNSVVCAIHLYRGHHKVVDEKNQQSAAEGSNATLVRFRWELTCERVEAA